jgi:putative exosortase-associated protein (TIGR04073 family)
MKKGILYLLLILALMESSAFAAGPFVKLGRGFTNLITGVLEIPAQMGYLGKDHDPVTAFFGGLFKGITFMILRELGGVYEIVTFPLPFPRGYEPLWEPGTVIEGFQKEYIGQVGSVQQ